MNPGAALERSTGLQPASSPWRVVKAVLFDLDGTLIDSAPDLAAAANWLRSEQGLEALPYERLRPLVGAGARGMVGAALGLRPQDEGFEAVRDRFLVRYAEGLLERTVVFSGVEPLLQALEARRLPWGVVTNKATRFAEPVLRGLGLDRRAAVVVCGDTTPQAKPHPQPLLEAARRLKLAPAECVYVGDDLRDVQAGQAAGMLTLAVRWGYLGEGLPIEEWGADRVLESPAELLQWLEMD